jgi:hypothetical protein
MTSGGARPRSGPAPDPNALRRDRKDDGEWTTLPREGFAGPIPDFPLTEATTVELDLWAELWEKPQGYMWDKLALKFQVATYVRTYLEANVSGASSSLKTAVMSMEAQLGLSTDGFKVQRWKFSEDELAEKRDEPAVTAGPSARDRWAARTGA